MMRLGNGGDEELAEAHEINVTPFIDVMLVLLIIFMVAAPLATVDVAVALPASTARPQPRPDKPVYLTIRGDRTLAVGEATVTDDGMGAALSRATGGATDQPIFIRADKRCRVRRPDGRAEPAAGRRLHQGLPRRTGCPPEPVTGGTRSAGLPAPRPCWPPMPPCCGSCRARHPSRCLLQRRRSSWI